MKILDIVFKDITRSFRSVFAIGMILVAPLLLTGLIYFAFGGMSSGDVSMTAVKVGIVNLDVLPVDAPLEAPLGEIIRLIFFDESVQSSITATDYLDEASARDAVNKQEIGVAVIIPRNFTERYLSGDQDVQQVLIISDPTLSVGPAIVKDIVTMGIDGFAGGGISRQTIMERLQANGIQTEPTQFQAWDERYGNWYTDFQRDLFHNPEKAAFVVVAPSADETKTENPMQKTMGMVLAGQMIFFAFFTGAYSMMSILEESEEGTLARLFSTPTNRTSILAGKFAAVFFTVILQGVAMMIAGHLIFGVTWGIPLSAALALTGQVIASTGLGVLLISLVKNTRQGGPVLGGGLTAMGMLGGLFTANMPNAMPAAMNTIANFTPQGWVLKAWRMVMDGGSTGDLLLPFGVLVGMGVVMFVIGAKMFGKRFA